MKVVNMSKVWRKLRLDNQIEDRINTVLRSWEGTPYMGGQQMKGQGVDCIRFCCGFLDDMYGYRRIELPRLPPDTAFHNKEKAEELVRWVLEQYRPNRLVTDHTIEPGDFLFSYPEGGGPSHGMIFGADGRIWHANGRPGRKGGVKGVGLSLMARAQAKVEIWRLEDKHKWVS